MNIKETTNPFTVVKAGDYTDQQILDYWVDIPDGDGFEGIVNPLSQMPMILIGGKGSGKTHLMRYFSYPLQKIRYKSEILEGIQREGFIGLYLRCGGLNSERFSGKNIDSEAWEQIFPYSFEIWLSQLILETLLDLIDVEDKLSFDEKALCDDLLDYFDEKPEGAFNSIQDILNGLKNIQKNIDIEINNCLISKQLNIRILASPGKLFFGFPEAINNFVFSLADTSFVYLIDELENLLEYQQKYIQTLIRDRKPPCCIKIGVRSYGIKTLTTLAAGEVNKEDAEFEYVRLDDQLRSRTKANYRDFAVEMCIKRLLGSGLVSDNINITKKCFYDFFEQTPILDELKETELLSSGLNGKTIKKLKSKLKKYENKLIETGLASKEELNKIPTLLAQEDLPLLERACVYEFYKKWSRSKNLFIASKEISITCSNYRKDKISELKFKGVIDKFKTDLNAQLLKDNNKKQIYAGVDNLIDLSRGFPRSLLTLLKHIYRHSIFNGETPFIQGRISINSQVEGVKQASLWYLDNAQTTGKDGGKLKIAVERLSELFKINRFSDKPSECSLRGFSTESASLSAETQRLMELASDWSLLLKDSDGRKNKNSERVDSKYLLNPMLAPHWGLPLAVRGIINFNSHTLNSIFDEQNEKDFEDVKKKFERARNTPFGAFDKAQTKQQIGIFDTPETEQQT